MKKNIRRQKKEPKKPVGVNTEENERLREYFNSLPSRVEIIGFKELIIKPESLIKNLSRFIPSLNNVGNFFGYFGIAVGFVAVINYFLDDILTNFKLPVAKSQLEIVIQVIVLAAFGISYLKAAYKDLAPLFETFHLKISGKNFIVHTGNIENCLANAPILDSEGNPNITIAIDEKKGRLEIDWAYGPDINHLITGERDFKAWMVPGLSRPYSFVSELTFGLISADPLYLPPLSLKDIQAVRDFFGKNKIEIQHEWTIDG